VARGAKLKTVTLADPAKRGGACPGSQGLHLQSLNETVAISPILPAPRDAPPTGALAGALAQTFACTNLSIHH
jgi:hypothetical protein